MSASGKSLPEFSLQRRKFLKFISVFSGPIVLAACGGGGGSSDANSTTPPTTLSTVSPQIVVHPVNKTITAGQPVSFSVTATGTNPLTYQWMRNGADIPGATTSTLTLPPVDSGENGDVFTVSISNTAGLVTSDPAILSVNQALVILMEPASLTITEGDIAVFEVFVSGTPPVSFQWTRNGATIPGATASTYSINPVLLGDDGSTYMVTVQDSSGTITSNPATLTVLARSTTIDSTLITIDSTQITVDAT
jgi:Immunoglobulin domain/Immunoglobulin I-set domain